MPREAEPSLNEKTFVSQALQENVRLDNRAFDEYRPIELSFGDEYGTAEVKLGKTRYVPPGPISSVYRESNVYTCAAESWPRPRPKSQCPTLTDPLTASSPSSPS